VLVVAVTGGCTLVLVVATVTGAGCCGCTLVLVVAVTGGCTLVLVAVAVTGVFLFNSMVGFCCFESSHFTSRCCCCCCCCLQTHRKRANS